MSFIYPEEYIKEHAGKDRMVLYPTISDIAVQEFGDCGKGVIALRAYARGELVGAFTGKMGHDLLQHTLQIDPENHIHDPYFVGYLLHSCDPNVVVDMHQRLVYCIKDIPAGTPLSMDYASTEDQLFSQFACGCGAPNCRQWVTGRAERVNEDGTAHLLGKMGINLMNTTAMPVMK